MRCVLACRDGKLARFIANTLAAADTIDGILVESGRGVRKRKIRRQFSRASALTKPLVPLDLVALAIYGKIGARNLHRTLLVERGWQEYPSGVERVDIDNINQPKALEYLTAAAPDVLIVLGTAIIKNPIIAVPRIGTLNIHGGIVPQYRNVHSDFWAYYRGDTQSIGTSILFLDEGVDTGDIVCQETIEFEARDGLLDVKRKNAELAGRLILQTVQDSKEGKLPRAAQPTSGAGVFLTPRAMDFARLFLGRHRVSGSNKRIGP